MKSIKDYFNFKDDKMEHPDIYIGARLPNMKLDSGNYCLTMSPEKYMKVSVKHVEEDLVRSKMRFLSKCVTLLSSN